MMFEPFGGLKSTTKAVGENQARRTVKWEYRQTNSQATAEEAERDKVEVERQAADLELQYFAFDILFYDGQVSSCCLELALCNHLSCLCRAHTCEWRGGLQEASDSWRSEGSRQHGVCSSCPANLDSQISLPSLHMVATWL